MLKEIVVVLLVVVLVMLGSATKLQNSIKISITGAVKGEADFDGSQDVTMTTEQDNIAVIEGTLKLNDSPDFVQYATTTTYIDFPKGFTKENCYVSSIGTKVLQANMGFAYGTTSEYDASDISRNLIPCQVLLGDQNGKIVLNAENIYADITLTYQIILMKK